MVAILVLLVAVGIEITKGLGWLTTQDWLGDFLTLLWVFAFVIFTAAIFAILVFTLIRRSKKRKQNINWDSHAEAVEPADNDNNKERL